MVNKQRAQTMYNIFFIYYLYIVYTFWFVEMRILCWFSSHTKHDRIKNKINREKAEIAPIVGQMAVSF